MFTAGRGRRQRTRLEQVHRGASAVLPCSVLLACLLLAACSSTKPTAANRASPTATRHLGHDPSPSKPASVPAGVNTTYPASTYPEQEAVLATWVAAEKQLYAYMDEPPAPLRADLIAGESGGELFPKLADYYTGAALTSEMLGMINLKLSLLNGPTHYNLGTPSIQSITSSTAILAFCGTDTGTTTSSGAPGPLDMDGGSGGARGESYFSYVNGSWLVYDFKTTGVESC